MARTRVPSEQLQFRSANTGDHILDNYLEDAEKGGKTISQLLGAIFNEVTGDIDAFEFRYANSGTTQTLEMRIGVNADFQEVASFTQLFEDLASFKATALADMEVKRQDAEDSRDASRASELDAEAARAAAEAARNAAQAARDLSQTYAAQAYQTTPTVIQQGILIAQLHGELFNGSHF